jgi:outer membrane protein OmpA-like peptidoglycan-associated protein
MFRETQSIVVFAAVLLALAGCASERVTLLPDENGKVGVVVVTARKGGEVRLDQAYGSARVEGGGVQYQQSSAGEVEKRYGTTLSAVPLGARSYVMRFVIEKATLLPESHATLKAVLDDYRKRPAPEVVIIGHTDKSGDAKYNEDLSRRRATAVRDLLIAGGVAAASIEVAWRGDREPLPETAGAIYDQRNRRVEVKVR